ncbi:MAG: hypothetical protein JKX97_02190 [Candidatus Lindowbacteria bacterium]|nr:hypothetical protein [Candidatus Lindowbacteria bacterium]
MTRRNGTSKAAKTLFLALLSVMVLCTGCEHAQIQESELRARIITYYEDVRAGRDPDIGPLREYLPDSALVTAIGWTRSGKVFYDVISGDVDHEKRHLIYVPNRPRFKGKRSMLIDVYTIRKTDLPEYFEFSKKIKDGFASINEDAVFLDARNSADTRVLQEAYEHELMHVLDRDIYEVLPPDMIEARAMLRGILFGQIPYENRDRIYYAVEQGEPHYKRAGQRLLEAFHGLLGPGGFSEATAEEIQDVAAVLSVFIVL